MRESAVCFHNLESPADGARLAGPVAWLRGWIVGNSGHDFIDVRVRHGGATHLGILGLPRVDLAAFFKAARAWLPAEFILGVPLPDGTHTLNLEAMDANGAWHVLQQCNVTVAPDGTPPPQVEGRIETRPEGSWTVRDAHHPFHGHLDEPAAAFASDRGRARVFGWLLDETRPLAAVLGTTDTLVFNHLAHSLTDDALARKVSHPGARHARLRGAVDVPATLPAPLCLRVYGISPDGTVALCFAKRISPAPTASASLVPSASDARGIGARALTPYPSARPRRLLFVVRSLWPNDETLRAFDLARHLVDSHRWAVRIVATEDGPWRERFESIGAESLIVDPAPFFSAADATSLAAAEKALQRAIWWRHLDAAVVFDPVCGWAIPPARQAQLPVLFDCSAITTLEPDPTAAALVQDALRASWRQATAVCFASQTAKAAQFSSLGELPQETVFQWFTPGVNTHDGAAPRPAIQAPLRTVDWLRRYHVGTLGNWRFTQGPAGGVDQERLAHSDDTLAPTAVHRTADWSVNDVALCLGPLFGRGPWRPIIDAAAAGIPAVTARTALTEEWFGDLPGRLVDEANPLALAHTFLAWSAVPISFQREADALAARFRPVHNPEVLLPRWEQLLASVIATHRS